MIHVPHGKVTLGHLKPEGNADQRTSTTSIHFFFSSEKGDKPNRGSMLEAIANISDLFAIASIPAASKAEWFLLAWRGFLL